MVDRTLSLAQLDRRVFHRHEGNTVVRQGKNRFKVNQKQFPQLILELIVLPFFRQRGDKSFFLSGCIFYVHVSVSRANHLLHPRDNIERCGRRTGAHVHAKGEDRSRPGLTLREESVTGKRFAEYQS